MSTDQTHNTPRPKFVPEFRMPFAELIVKDPIFETNANALEWVNEHGSSVLKAQAEEVVKNLLSAASEERRTRGVLILTRAVLAQVAWLELFQIWSTNGRFTQLKKATDAVRDADASEEDHQQACQDLLQEHMLLLANIEDDKLLREVALAKIGDLLAEKPFIERLEEQQLLLDRRPKVKDQEWAIKALDLVIAGKPEKVRTATLVALAGNLEFHARRFFGEGNTPDPKAKKVRGGRSAEKRAADRAFTLANKGPGKSGSKAKR